MVATPASGGPWTGAERSIADGDAAALKQSEARYRAVVEDQTELICRFLADGTYTFVNDAYCRYFARSREALLGNSFWEFIPLEWHARARAFLDSITPDNPVAEIEHAVIAPNGEPRWQQWRDRGFFDDHGQIIEFQAVGRDITDRVRVEEALKESQQELKELANHVPVHIWMNDGNGRIQFMNARFLEYTGTSAEAPPRYWTEVLHPSDAGLFLRSYRAALEDHAEHRAQVRLRNQDGEYHWFDVIGLPRFEGERLLGYLGCSIDVTERRRTEQQHSQLEAQKLVADALREVDRRKDEFLALLSHELRNPLAPIVMALEILRTPDTTLAMSERARDVIGRQIDHLKRLVDDLLDVSRISRGTINVEFETLDLRRVVADALETSAPWVHAGGHLLSTNLPDHPLPIRGDAVRLCQVISNLLNNAAKYSLAGGLIHLSAHSVGDDAVITVSDTGRGIPTDMLERVFEPFTQVDTSRVRPVDGLGLGLTLVKRLVGLHGGFVEARSTGLGQGSEFVVQLPLSTGSDANLDDLEPAIVDSLRGNGGPLRILIVDDNVDYALTLAEVLKLRGHEVYAVHDGPSAIDATAQMTPDVVLLDLGLPGMDGLQVAQFLRGESRCSNTLMIAISGYGRHQESAHLTQAGFDHHLVKPVDIAVIEALIASPPDGQERQLPQPAR